MNLESASRQNGDVVIADLKGRITLGQPSEALRRMLSEWAEQGKTKVILNLANVDFIDSAGIGQLSRGYILMSNKGGKLKLLRPQERVRDVLEITRLITVIEVFEDEAAAVESFG
jgi:anti-sigma B factor antagonist